MSEYSEYWNLMVKKLAQEVIEKATTDKEMIEYFVSGIIFGVEHDLADGREAGMLAISSLTNISGVFTDKSYFEEIHQNTPKKEVERLRKLGREVKKLISLLRCKK